MSGVLVEGVAALCTVDRTAGAALVRAVLDTACDPHRRRRESLGYYLSPGMRSWERMVELEALLTGEQHAVVARRRWIEHGVVAGEPRDPRLAIVDRWSQVVQGKTSTTLLAVARKDDGTDAEPSECVVVTRLGAWALVDCGEHYSLTWGPTGEAGLTGSLEQVREHFDAMAALRDHSSPDAMGGGPSSSALGLVRARLRDEAQAGEQALAARGGA